MHFEEKRKQVSKDFATRRHQTPHAREGSGAPGESSTHTSVVWSTWGGASKGRTRGLETGDPGQPRGRSRAATRQFTAASPVSYPKLLLTGILAHTHEPAPKQHSRNNNEKGKPNSWTFVFRNSTYIPFQFSRRDETSPFKQMSNKCIWGSIARKHKQCSSSIENKTYKLKATQSKEEACKTCHNFILYACKESWTTETKQSDGKIG